MQNNPDKKSGSFGKMMKEKGYYIVLFLCIIAVGISGYIFVRTARSQNQAATASETLSVPLTPETQKSNKPSSDSSGDAANAQSAQAAAVTEPGEGAQAEAAQPAAVTTVQPVSGSTTASYSMDALAYNDTMRDWRTHDGVDIAAEDGTQVVAARDGSVTAVYDDDALGRVVTISHDGGYVTTYASLNEDTLVSVGDTVKAGDAIGTVGNTAKLELSEGAHLHFAVSCNGSPIDPATFLD